ncbi:MAG: hypothetical protein FWD78_02995 [Treponema sp.]|nr:hypothetical protein [Treponema sp.]
MTVVKETEKARLLEKDGIRFWVQKRWHKNGRLTPAGVKAFAIAAREQRLHPGFDASKIFEVMVRTEKAVLLRCEVDTPKGISVSDFWVPLSMTGNFQFIKQKLEEVEARYPFVGSRVRWAG